MGFPGGSAGKESACNAGDLGLISGLGRSPGGREKLPAPVFWPGESHGLCNHYPDTKIRRRQHKKKKMADQYY